MAQADAMVERRSAKIFLIFSFFQVSSGLAALGYQYINVDDGWASGRYENGSIYENSSLFPHGMRYLADYIHSKVS